MITVKTNLKTVAKRLTRLSRQADKTASNKAIAAVRTAAAAVIRETYRLPAYGPREQGENGRRYGLPAISSLIAVSKIETLGGLGIVRARLTSSTKPISLIRFMRGTPPSILPQKGIPVRRRGRYRARIGSRQAPLGSGFVAQVSKSRVRQTFRRMRGKFNPRTHKQKIAKQSLPSVHVVLGRADNFARLVAAAVSTFRTTFTKALEQKWSRH